MAALAGRRVGQGIAVELHSSANVLFYWCDGDLDIGGQGWMLAGLLITDFRWSILVFGLRKHVFCYTMTLSYVSVLHLATALQADWPESVFVAPRRVGVKC